MSKIQFCFCCSGTPHYICLPPMRFCFNPSCQPARSNVKGNDLLFSSETEESLVNDRSSVPDSIRLVHHSVWKSLKKSYFITLRAPKIFEFSRQSSTLESANTNEAFLVIFKHCVATLKRDSRGCNNHVANAKWVVIWSLLPELMTE